MFEMRWLVPKDPGERTTLWYRFRSFTPTTQALQGLGQSPTYSGYTLGNWEPWKEVPEIHENEVEPENLNDALILIRKMRLEAKSK